MRLSILDQSPIKSGSTPAEAVQETLDLAQAAERLGYHRYWVAEQIADLVGYLGDCLPANHPFARVRAMPAGPTAPEVWLLGSSDQSALYAAHFGLGFSF